MVRDPETITIQTAPDAGFTLVEVIVSMVLLGLVALLMLPVVVMSAKAGIANRDIATAAQVADAELDRARGTAATLAGCATVLAAHDGNLGVPATGYRIHDTVTGTCAAGGLLTVRVSVASTANPSRTATAATQVVIGS